MSITRMVVIVLLAVSGVAGASHALARGPFYVGASAGRSSIEDDIALPGLITSGTVDGRDTGYKIFVGYEFHPNFAMEVAVVDLGKARYSGMFGSATVTGGTVDVWGFNFSAVGILPVNPSFALFAKIGFFSWEASWKDVTGGIHFSERENGADLSLGLGAAFNFTKDFSARLEWERLKAGGGEDYYTGFQNLTSRAHIDFFSLGVVFKF